MCNFNRLNETFFGPGDCWPEELDWLGFDIYGFDPAVSFGLHPTVTLEKQQLNMIENLVKRLSCTAN